MISTSDGPLNSAVLRSRHFLALASAALLLGLASPLFSQEVVFDLDPARTQIEFTLGDVLHTVHGIFRLKQGTIRVDTETGKAGGSVIVDATSGDSGSGARDRKMHKDILESLKYPEVTITPVKILGHLAATGESQVELQGIFKLHGTDHEITMTASAQVTGDQWTAKTVFVVPYVQWGLKNPSTFLLRVSDRVEVHILAAGRIRFAPEH